MTIALIIPTLNEAATIGRTLTQAVAQEFDEIIVSDGGSTDPTPAMVQACCDRVPSARLVTASPGRARQMNAGAAASRSDVLLFLHADTELPPNAKALIEATLSNPNAVSGRFDVRFDRPSRWGRMISWFMNRRSRMTGIATGDQAIFVRRSVFDRLGGFTDIPLMEDIDFSRRIKRHGAMAAVPEPVITSFRRWEQNGPLRTILLMWTLRFLYWLGVSPHHLNRWYRTVR